MKKKTPAVADAMIARFSGRQAGLIRALAAKYGEVLVLESQPPPTETKGSVPDEITEKKQIKETRTVHFEDLTDDKFVETPVMRQKRSSTMAPAESNSVAARSRVMSSSPSSGPVVIDPTAYCLWFKCRDQAIEHGLCSTHREVHLEERKKSVNNDALMVKIVLRETSVAARGTADLAIFYDLTMLLLNVGVPAVKRTIKAAFSEFDKLKKDLTAWYKKHHISLLPNFTKLNDQLFPPKAYKLFTNHMGFDFIEKRREQLQAWITAVSDFQFATVSPPFLTFLQLNETKPLNAVRI